MFEFVLLITLGLADNSSVDVIGYTNLSEESCHQAIVEESKAMNESIADGSLLFLEEQVHSYKMQCVRLDDYAGNDDAKK